MPTTPRYDIVRNTHNGNRQRKTVSQLKVFQPIAQKKSTTRSPVDTKTNPKKSTHRQFKKYIYVQFSTSEHKRVKRCTSILLEVSLLVENLGVVIIYYLRSCQDSRMCATAAPFDMTRRPTTV